MANEIKGSKKKSIGLGRQVLPNNKKGLGYKSKFKIMCHPIIRFHITLEQIISLGV